MRRLSRVAAPSRLRRPFTALVLGVAVATGDALAVSSAAVRAEQGKAARITVTTTATFDGDPLVDTVADGKGRINYSAGVIKATGYGAMPAADTVANPGQAKLMALGAAKADALRNLAMAVNSVRVTSSTRVRNYVLEDDTVKTEISALLQSPRFVSEKFDRDGTATVVVELPLYGKESVAAVVLPRVLKEAPSEPVASAPIEIEPAPSTAPGTSGGVWKGPDKPAIRITPRRAPAPAPSLGREPGLTPTSDNGPFSSVIVDCRGLNVEAIMSPKLYDASGREVYGTVRVSHDYAIEVGIVGYPRSMSQAIQGARAGSHPLIVRAIGVADKHRFNPVISADDGDRILDANSRDRFLEKTAVIFLVDPIRY